MYVMFNGTNIAIIETDPREKERLSERASERSNEQKTWSNR